MTTDYAVLNDLESNGFTFVAILAGSKKPASKGWKTIRLTAAEAAEHAREGGNVGVHCGVNSNGLICIDFDSGALERAAKYGFLDGALRICRSDNQERIKYFVRVVGPLPGTRHREHDGICLLSTGSQAVVLGTHPLGGWYLVEQGSIPVVTLERLNALWLAETGETLTPVKRPAYTGSPAGVDPKLVVCALEALSFVRCDDRDYWFRVGIAIKASGISEGFTLWDTWSQRSSKYDAANTRRVWDSFAQQGEITVGTLFGYANEDSPGWRQEYQDVRCSADRMTALALRAYDKSSEGVAELRAKTGLKRIGGPKATKLALDDLAVRYGLTFVTSIRTLASATNQCLKTIQNHLKAFHEGGIINLSSSQIGTLIEVIPTERGLRYTCSYHGGDTSVYLTPPPYGVHRVGDWWDECKSHDAFAWASLSRAHHRMAIDTSGAESHTAESHTKEIHPSLGWAALDLLYILHVHRGDAKGLTGREIARLTWRSLGSIRIARRRLKKHGLIIAMPRHCYRIHPDAETILDEIVTKLASYGTGQRRAYQYAKERFEFLSMNAKWAAADDPIHKRVEVAYREYQAMKAQAERK